MLLKMRISESQVGFGLTIGDEKLMNGIFDALTYPNISIMDNRYLKMIQENDYL